MLLAGRGFGKTRTGAEWIRGYAEVHPGARIALVAASLHEGRQVMIEGESGLLAIAPDHDRPDYESSLRRLSWANGAVATLYSAAEPERSEEHTSELQSLMRISYAVFCLTKKKNRQKAVNQKSSRSAYSAYTTHH